MPVTTAARIAARAAPEMSSLARSAFDAGRTVYGSPRPRSADGKALTLEKTGRTRASLQFAATGRDIRLTRLPGYAVYLINGPRGQPDRYILPNGPLPVEWRDRMTEIAAGVLHDQLFGAVE